MGPVVLQCRRGRQLIADRDEFFDSRRLMESRPENDFSRSARRKSVRKAQKKR
jgi:hypothetical protein